MSEPSVPPPPPPPYTPPPPPAGPASGAVSPNRGIMIVLSYIWLVNLVPLLTEKDDKEVQWHAKNGIVLMIASWIVLAAVWIVQMVLFATHFLAFLGCLVTILYLVVWLGILVVHVICIIKGTQGQRFLIPGISQYADKF
ncbi:MAG TPA: hypothetical protein VHB47_07905 [Thermoanaerobaculia bacterium]|jgi:uncharacterized membrane protein|nr:hypothetical protein [Thermoanaerobaculia bacterium]